MSQQQTRKASTAAPAKIAKDATTGSLSNNTEEQEQKKSSINFDDPGMDKSKLTQFDADEAVSADPDINVDGLGIFSHILFPEPSIIIDNEFITVRSTISPGTSATSYNGVKRLISLLEKHKNDIEGILNPNQVYAIGPDFQQGCTIPNIACWVNGSLIDEDIEKLSNIFDNEFEIVVIHLDTDDSNSFGYKTQQSGDKNEPKDKRNDDDSGQKDYNRNNKENNREDKGSNEKNSGEASEKNGDGSSRRNGKGSSKKSNDDEYKDSSKDDDNKYLLVASTAVAKVANTIPEIEQEFSINARVWANISNKNNEQSIKFEVWLFDCRMDEPLSRQWKLLNGKAIAYIFDSIEISVSPNPSKVGAIMPENAYEPLLSNQETECSKGKETSKNIGGKVGCEIGTTSKFVAEANLNCSARNIHNNKSVTSEWNLKTKGSNKSGICWSYEYTTDNNADYRTDFPFDNHHRGNWAIGNMVGFRIVIKQVLRYAIIKGNTYKKKHINITQCPKMAHTLEIYFKTIENFNVDFAALKKRHFIHGDLTVTLNNIKVANDTQNVSELMDINRDFMQIDRKKKRFFF
ncbi:11559_t:CDS:2 [Scutellospora calospora]|uniref:11559_t:CDS:1 n=1 Tax=Scutellospora calospora TaxID=85575 RepID=A0ACA9KUS0_9GLOM|nr:11559_t:CDS:2 [Scutellospora calospora]